MLGVTLRMTMTWSGSEGMSLEDIAEKIGSCECSCEEEEKLRFRMGVVIEVEDEDPSLVVEVEVEGCMTLNPRARESVRDLFCS